MERRDRDNLAEIIGHAETAIAYAGTVADLRSSELDIVENDLPQSIIANIVLTKAWQVWETRT